MTDIPDLGTLWQSRIDGIPVPLFWLDAARQMATQNQACRDLMPQLLEQLPGESAGGLRVADQWGHLQVMPMEDGFAGILIPQDLTQAIFTHAPIGMVVIHVSSQRFVHANPVFCQLVQYELAELQRKTHAELTYPRDLHQELITLGDFARNPSRPCIYEKRMLSKHHELVWVRVTAAFLDAEHLLAMVEDVTERKVREEELQKSEARFRQVFEDGAIGMAIVGFHYRLIQVNAMLCQLTGYSEAELLSRPFDWLLVPEGCQDYSALQKQLYYGRLPHYQIETQCRCKNGDLIWILLTVYGLRDVKGRASLSLAMVRDISQQKLAQEELSRSLIEKDILLREIHHRVKNNLHIIINLLDLQTQLVQDPTALNQLQESQNRIQAIALIHEQLYQSPSLGAIPFEPYLQHLVASILSTGQNMEEPIRCHLDITPVSLNMETAIPCGLIVNELLTNALKHAFPQGGGGDIFLEFRELPPTDRQRLFRLTVRDNGIGLDEVLDLSNTNTLGLRLVHLLIRQLEGTVGYSGAGGAEFCLTFSESNYRDRMAMPN
ncbi:MAG: PAS domain S-box protein [Oscillatoriales cyanobacterium SM2_2_1]|nr:PAS domain S-box protein [Oscillatoriales cyanobacterium SM2_2_1]